MKKTALIATTLLALSMGAQAQGYGNAYNGYNEPQNSYQTPGRDGNPGRHEGWEKRRDDPNNVISHFTAEPSGSRIFFTVHGEPGARVQTRIEPLGRTVKLNETEPGRYEGYYSLRRGENLNDARYRAVWERRGERASSWADRGAPRTVAVQPAYPAQNLWRVESITQVTVDGSNSPSVPGMLLGGVVGGVLGNQVGGGTGKKLATIAGVAGGAYAGNQIAKNQGSNHTLWRVTVRQNSGVTQTVDFDQQPALRVGDMVAKDNNQLTIVQR